MAEEDGFVVRLKGLPWAVTDDDILKFFGNLIGCAICAIYYSCLTCIFGISEDLNIVGGADGIHMTYYF
jgi:hypothetical protein